MNLNWASWEARRRQLGTWETSHHLLEDRIRPRTSVSSWLDAGLAWCTLTASSVTYMLFQVTTHASSLATHTTITVPGAPVQRPLNKRISFRRQQSATMLERRLKLWPQCITLWGNQGSRALSSLLIMLFVVSKLAPLFAVRIAQFERLTPLLVRETRQCYSWRPTELWNIEAFTLSRKSAHRWGWYQQYSPAALYSSEYSRYSLLLEAESTSVSRHSDT
jgi:hypothetical protein